MSAPESIFKAVIRKLLVSAAAVIGIFVGLIPAMGLFTMAVGDEKEVVHPKSKMEVMPDLTGKRKAISSDGPVVLQLNMTGVIGVMGPEGIRADRLRDVLIDSQGDVLEADRVKAILMKINTPGGTAIDSENIFRLLKNYRERYQVPVYGYIDGLCASGGMYLASACDRVYASDASIVGSVGVVFSPFFNLTGAMEKVGVTAMTLAVGDSKDAMNPFRVWKSGEEESYQKLLNFYYLQFIDLVTENRPRLDKDKLLYEYGARVFPAPEAAEYGYIDASGYTYERVLEELLEVAAIDQANYSVVQLSPKKTLIDFLEGDLSLLKGKVTHQVELTGVPSELMNKVLYLYSPGL